MAAGVGIQEGGLSSGSEVVLPRLRVLVETAGVGAIMGG